MTDPITEQQKTFHHLLVIGDGEVLVNELFHSKRELAESFVTGLHDNTYDIGLDVEDIEAAVIEADEEAAAADYPEGVTPPAPGDPLNYLDALSELLAAENIDLHIDTICAPERAG
jgi:hypothetical protein